MEQLNFEIGKSKYYVRDLTIQDYYDMQLKLTLNDQQTGFEIVSTLSDCPIDELKKLKYDQWLALWYTVQETIHRTITLDDKFSPVVEIDNQKFGMIDLDNITIGEFSDLDIILTSTNADKRMHEAIAVLYRPIIWQSGNKYKIEEYSDEDFVDRVELFKSFPLSKARIAITFFLRSGNSSLKAMLDYLVLTIGDLKTEDLPEHLKTQIKMTQTKLQEVGSELSSQLGVRIRFGWRKRLGLKFVRLLIGSRGKLMKLKSKISKTKNNNNKIEE
jgi:hypothetical protein